MRWKFWRKETDSKYNVFYPKERVLFKYFNGEKEVAVDPLVAYKNFITASTELRTSLKTALNLSQQGEYYDKLLSQIKDLFSVKQWTEEEPNGLTNAQMLELFDHFLEFCGGKVETGQEMIKEAGESWPKPEEKKPERSENKEEDPPPNSVSPNTSVAVNPNLESIDDLMKRGME